MTVSVSAVGGATGPGGRGPRGPVTGDAWFSRGSLGLGRHRARAVDDLLLVVVELTGDVVALPAAGGVPHAVDRQVVGGHASREGPLVDLLAVIAERDVPVRVGSAECSERRRQ